MKQQNCHQLDTLHANSQKNKYTISLIQETFHEGTLLEIESFPSVAHGISPISPTSIINIFQLFL